MKKRKKEPEKMVQINFRDVKLTKESRKSLKKVKTSLWGNVANEIEWGNWWFPSKSHVYSTMVSDFERGMYEFFSLDEKEYLVKVESFSTDIIEYDR